jgi:hypothetical protein
VLRREADRHALADQLVQLEEGHVHDAERILHVLRTLTAVRGEGFVDRGEGGLLRRGHAHQNGRGRQS